MLKDGRLLSSIVSCEWLNQNQDLNRLIILDASVTNDVTAETVIPNSKSIDIKGKFSDVNARFPNTMPTSEQFEHEVQQLGIHKDSIVVVYDNKGLYWSPRVWWLFKTFGFENIAVLDGGLPEWKRLGYDTRTTPITKVSSTKGDFSANYIQGKLIGFQELSKAINSEAHLILDARSSDRFHGILAEPRAGLRSGTIPNSKNLPYLALLKTNCLKTTSELQTIFDTFDIGERTLIFSCGSGITACISALAAEVCGYKKLAVYDGSWTEYGTLTT